MGTATAVKRWTEEDETQWQAQQLKEKEAKRRWASKILEDIAEKKRAIEYAKTERKKFEQKFMRQEIGSK